MNKYQVLNSNYESLGEANTLKEVQAIIGISKRRLYTLRKANPFDITFKKNRYIILDKEMQKMNELLIKVSNQIDETVNKLNNTNNIFIR